MKNVLNEVIGPPIDSTAGRAFIAGDFSHGKARRSVPKATLVSAAGSGHPVIYKRPRRAGTLESLVPGDADLGEYAGARGRVNIEDVEFTIQMYTQNSGCVAVANSGKAVRSEDFDLAGCCYYDNVKVTIDCEDTKVNDTPYFKRKTNALVYTEFGTVSGEQSYYESVFDLNYDGQHSLRDFQLLFYVLGGGNALVQQPPSSIGRLRGTPLRYLSPTNETSCKMEIETSVFIPSDAGDLFTVANDNITELDTMLKVYVVLADDSSTFAGAATEAISGASNISVILGGNPSEGGKGAIISMTKSTVTDVFDDENVTSGVYVNFLAKLHSSLSSEIMVNTQASIAVALRPKPSITTENPEAFVEYMPPQVNHKRPLVMSAHLGGWNRKLGDGTGRVGYCESEIDCIYSSDSDVVGFSIPAGINGSDTCWTECDPINEVIIKNRTVNEPPICVDTTTTTSATITSTTTSVSSTTTSVTTTTTTFSTTTTTISSTTTTGTSTTYEICPYAADLKDAGLNTNVSNVLLLRAGAQSINQGSTSSFAASDTFVHGTTTTACADLDHRWQTPSGTAAKVWLGGEMLQPDIRAVSGTVLQTLPVATVHGIVLTPHVYFDDSGSSAPVRIVLVGYSKDGGEPMAGPSQVELTIEAPDLLPDVPSITQTVTLDRSNNWRSTTEISLPSEWFGSSSLFNAAATARIVSAGMPSTVIGATMLHPRSRPVVDEELQSQRLEALLPYRPLYSNEDLVVDVYARTSKPLQAFSVAVKIDGDGAGVHFGAAELSAFNAPGLPVGMNWQSTIQLPNGRAGATASMFSRRDLSNKGCVDSETGSWCPDRERCECGVELLFQIHLRIPSNAVAGSYDLLISLSSDVNVDGEPSISARKVNNVGIAAVLEGRPNDASGNVALHVNEHAMVAIFSRLAGGARMVNTAVINGIEVKQPLDIYGVSDNGSSRRLGRADGIECTLSESAIGVLQTSDTFDCANIVLDAAGTHGGKGVELLIVVQGTELSTLQRVSVWHPLLDSTFNLQFMDNNATVELNAIAGWTDKGADGTCASPRAMYQHAGFRSTVDFRTSADDADADSTFTEDITGLITAYEPVDDQIAVVESMSGQPTNVNVRVVRGLLPGTTQLRAIGPSFGSDLCPNCKSDTFSVVSDVVIPTTLHAIAVDTEKVTVTNPDDFRVCVALPQSPPTLIFEGVKVQIVTVVQFDDGSLMELLPEHGLELVSVANSSIATTSGSRIVHVPSSAQNASGGIIQAFWNPPCAPEQPLVRSCAVLEVQLAEPIGVTAVPESYRLTRPNDSAEAAGISTRTKVDVELLFNTPDSDKKRIQAMHGDERTIVTIDAAGEKLLEVRQTTGDNGEIYLSTIAGAPIGKAVVTISFKTAALTATFEITIVEYTRFHIVATPEPNCSDWSVDPTKLSKINGTFPETFQQATLACKMEISDGDFLPLDRDLSQITLVDTSTRNTSDDKFANLVLNNNNTVIPRQFGSAAAHCEFARNETSDDQALTINATGTVSVQEITSITAWQGTTPLSSGPSNAFRGKAGVDAATSCIQVRMTDGHCYGENNLLCSPFDADSELPGLPRFAVEDVDSAANVDANTGVVTLQGNSLRPVVLQVMANVGTGNDVNLTTRFNANLDPVDPGDVDIGEKDGAAIKALVVGESLEVEVRVNTNGKMLETFDIYLQHGSGDIGDLLDGTVAIDTADAAVRTSTSCKSVLVAIYRGTLRINGKCSQSNNLRNEPRNVANSRWLTPGIAVVIVKLKATKDGIPSLSGYVKALTSAGTKVTIGKAIADERPFISGDFSHGIGRRSLLPSFVSVAGNEDVVVRGRRASYTSSSVPGDADFGSYPSLINGQSGRGRCDNQDLTFFDEWFNVHQTCTDSGIITATSPIEREDLLFKYKCCYKITHNNQSVFSGAVCTTNPTQAGTPLQAEDVNGIMCMTRESALSNINDAESNSSRRNSSSSCCYLDGNIAGRDEGEQDGMSCPLTAQDGYNVVRSDAYVEVSKMASNSAYTDYWGKEESSITLWEHFMDLDFDGLITAKDILYLHWSLVGLRVLVQEPPNLLNPMQVRSTPVVFNTPSSWTDCQLQATTSLFLIAGTDIYDMAVAGEQLDDVVKLFLVLAEPSTNFTVAMNESVTANTSTGVHLIEGVGVLVKMVQQLTGSNVIVVDDDAGKPAGAYVEFTAAFDSSIGNATSLKTKVSLAVATRQQATGKDTEPEATVVYMPMRTNHMRPLITDVHLDGWGSHSYAFCEKGDESCIYDELSGTAGFAFPIGMDSTESCWPQASQVPVHTRIWWIMALFIILTLVIAAIACRKPAKTPTIIDSIFPENGFPGDEVTITGTYLCGGDPEENVPSIRLAGITVKRVVGTPTDEEVTVIAGHAPPGTSGVAQHTLPSKSSTNSEEDPECTESPEDVLFTYCPEFQGSQIQKVVPPTGVPGEEIEIIGNGLKGGYNENYEQVTLAGIPVKRIVGKPTDTKVTVIVGEADPGTSGTVVLESSFGGKHSSDNNTLFTYREVFERTVVTSISPNEGVSGDLVTIEGEYLCGGYKRAIQDVLLAGFPVGKIVGHPTDTKIVVVAGEAPASTSDIVTLKSKWGDTFSTPKDLTFSYFKAFHNTTITRISPDTGEGGSQVTIFGSNLLGGDPEGISSVTLAGISVRRIVGTPFVDQLTVIVGHAAGGTVGNIVLYGGSGGSFQSPPDINFTYDEDDEDDFDFSGPTIEDVNPRFGTPGTVVIITGSKLPDAGDVYLAGILAKPIGEQRSRTQITVVVGDAEPGTKGTVKFQSSSGSTLVQTTSITFSYLEAFRNTVITRIEPNRGFKGTEVTIYGKELHGGDQNGVSNVLLAGITVDSIVGHPTDSNMKVIAGDAPPETKGIVTLQTAAGASFETEWNDITFEYWPDFHGLVVTDISPLTGNAGCEVVITGKCLNTTPLESVSIAGIEAKIVGRPSATSITVRVGDAAPGTKGPVCFEAASGTSFEVPHFIWSFFQPSQIISFEPEEGLASTSIEIVGEGMLMGSEDIVSVTVAGIPATFQLATATNHKLTVCTGTCKIDLKTRMGPKGPIVITGLSGQTITSRATYKYNATAFAFNEGQRMSLVNEFYSDRRGTFTLGKALRQTTTRVEDAIDLSTGIPLASQEGNLGHRIAYSTYDKKAEKKPTWLKRSEKVDPTVNMTSMLSVRAEEEAVEVKRRWVEGMGYHADELESFADERKTSERTLGAAASAFVADATMALAVPPGRKPKEAKTRKARKAKANGMFDTVRRNQLKKGEVEKTLPKLVLQTMKFPQGSEFEDCVEGETVQLVNGGKLPEGFMIQTEGGKRLIHKNAFVKDLTGGAGGGHGGSEVVLNHLYATNESSL
jgi:hypothetical protein